ncbi:hypothetical protein ACFV0C_13610 [Streptomyces sp. NPDC059568]|uniref:hypothetical protein n=1 Tax=Streptomyces sp. NPDC059568 TaxID=3346868 RepID=UPI0036906901
MSASTRSDARRNAGPYLYGREMAAIARVLESGQYGHTDVTEEFERRIAGFLGVPVAVAVAPAPQPSTPPSTPPCSPPGSAPAAR